MRVPQFLRPVLAVLRWPTGRFGLFRDLRKTYEVALAPSDTRAVVRGAIGTDPMYLPVMDGIVASRRSDVVGDVDDEGRLQIYIGGRYGTGLGLVGRVSASGPGSRITTRVGWTSMHRWYAPAITALTPAFGALVVYEAARESGGLVIGISVLLVLLLTGGRIFSLRSTAREARRTELPLLVERLEQALAPHVIPRP